MIGRKGLAYALTGILVFSGALVWIDPAGGSLRGWLAYALVCAIGALGMRLAWSWMVRGDSQRWLLACLMAAFLLRMGVAVALTRGLPVFGYDEKVQRAGYVFYDAYKRDSDAWAVARSDQSLWLELTEPRSTDQYGGMLFLSAATYRILSPDVHRPLLITLFASLVSTLGVLFTWGFVERTFGARASRFAAWTFAIYPEGVLLASSQMREPFGMTAIAAALYGYALVRDGQVRQGMLAIVIAGAAVLAISPPYALLTLATVAVAVLWEGWRGKRQTWSVGLPLVVIGVASAFLIVQAWTALGEISGSPLEAALRWWENVGAQWRLNLTEDQSRWMSTLFDVLPSWGQLPFVVFYGMVQPLLPAAIAYPGAAIWRAIAIWRSIGWYGLLPFILYAPFPALRKGNRRSLEAFLIALVWVGAVVAAYRATSYQWDSPRYRAVFLAAQAALAAWAWDHARHSRSPWLARSAMLLAVPTLALLAWYVGRYYGWVSIDLIGGMAASLIIDAGLLVWWLIRQRSSVDPPVSGET